MPPKNKTEKKAEKATAALKDIKSKSSTGKGKGAATSEEGAAFIKKMEAQGLVGDIDRPVDFISTGNWVTDRIIGDGKGGSGGWPRGYMSEVSGKESCGKTTMCLQSIPGVQKAGEMVIYADFEKSLRAQRHYLKSLGVNWNDKKTFLHLEPNTFEEGAKVLFEALVTLRPALLIIDSLPAMIPASFLTGDIDEATKLGLHARCTGILVGTLNKVLTKTNTAVVFVNQLRSKIGGMGNGPQTDTPGGMAFKFYMTLRIQCVPTDKVGKDNQDSIAGAKVKVMTDQRVKVTAIKNKIDMPFRSESLYLRFGKGFDGMQSLFDLAVQRGVLVGKGWYSYTSKENESYNFKIQSKEKVIAYLEEHPETVEDMMPHLFPEVDVNEYIAAKAEGELEGEDMPDEMADMLEQMASNLANVSKPVVETSEED